MKNQIEFGDITADVVLKDIKNIHLSVYPPSGNVRISAPLHLNIDTIRVFALTKLAWIKKQRQKYSIKNAKLQESTWNEKAIISGENGIC